MTDDQLVGKILRAPNGGARIIVCSQLLGIALLERLDEHDQPTGHHAYADPNTFHIAFPENA